MAAKQGFLSTILNGDAIVPKVRLVSAIDRVAAHQGWPLRRVPMYSVV